MPRYETLRRCGCVSIVSRGGRCYLRWRDEAGEWRLRSAGTTEPDEAEPDARRLADDLDRAERIRRESAVGRVRIDAAIESGLRHARGQTRRHQEQQVSYANLFCDWLTRRHPEVVYWDQLRRSMLVGYIDATLETGVSARTVQLRLNPLRLANNRMLMVDPDVYEALFAFKHPRLRAKRPEMQYMSRAQLLFLLEDAGEVARIAVLLCGFAGLRLTEAANLQVDDVDARRGTIRIGGTKNEYSGRSLPVAPWIMARLVAWMPRSGWLCARPAPATAVGPHELISDAIRRAIRRCLRRSEFRCWRSLEAWPERIAPRNLRTSFAMMADAAGVDKDVLRCYMGQRPETVLTKHYVQLMRPDSLMRVVEAMERHYERRPAVVVDLSLATAREDSMGQNMGQTPLAGRRRHVVS